MKKLLFFVALIPLVAGCGVKNETHWGIVYLCNSGMRVSERSLTQLNGTLPDKTSMQKVIEATNDCLDKPLILNIYQIK